jgi:hypothetical protein
VYKEEVLQSQLAVLSPYKAQCSELNKQLAKDFPSVTVSTVVAAQGLFLFDKSAVNVESTRVVIHNT